MMLTTSTRAEFWEPRNLAMTVAVGRGVCTADNTRGSVVCSAVALMQRWEAMCLHIRLQRNAILFFAHVASRASLRCVRTVSIRVEHWGELDAAAKLLRHLSEVRDSPLQDLGIVVDPTSGKSLECEQWPE
eukprot:3608367-Rhodomonas_salina.1